MNYPDNWDRAEQEYLDPETQEPPCPRCGHKHIESISLDRFKCESCEEQFSDWELHVQ